MNGRYSKSYISVFGGTGFVGSTFVKKYSDISIVEGKNHIKPHGTVKKVLYLISTVDNYNVLSNPYIDIETNLTHLIRVLENCKDKDIEFTFISSWFVYGDTSLPAFEYSYCNPKGFYSITKYAAEKLLESYCKTYDVKYKIIRLANVIGKSDSKVSKKKNALQYLIEEMKYNRPIKLYNNGRFYRDFIHVDDVASGIKHVMDYGSSGEIYNLGSCQQPILFSDIIDYAKDKLDSTSEIGTMSPTEFHKIVQVESMYLDCHKIMDIGFKPSMNVYQAIDTLL